MDEGYRRRVVDDEIDAVFPHLAAFSLQGARGVGKTETALQRAASVWRLDDPFRAQVASADPESVLADAVPVLIDEWQRLPAIWDFVRRSVDARAPGGSFLLTGSMVPLEHPVHSGAGRIPAIRMRPMSLMERLQAPPTVSVSRLMDGGRPPLRGSTPLTLSDYAHEIVRTGFPGLRDLPDRTRRLQLEAYIESLMERDFEQLGHRVRAPATLLRWLTAYASATSTTASFEAIRRAASPGEANPPPPPPQHGGPLHGGARATVPHRPGAGVVTRGSAAAARGGGGKAPPG